MDLFVLLQAYAELEADTPGTVFGVTQKSDGKWGQKASANQEKTQSAEYDSSKQDSHDNTDEENRAETGENQRLWKIAGGFLVLAIVLYLSQRKPSHSDTWITNEFVHDRNIKSDAENRERFKEA